MKITQQIVVCLLMFIGLNAAAQIKIARGDSFELALTNPIEYLTLPVDLQKNFKIADTSVEIYDVKLLTFQDNMKILAFESAKIIDSAGTITLKIRVNRAKIISPGTYSLFLKVKLKAKSDSVQNLNVKIGIKSAVVKPIATLLVNRFEPLWPGDAKINAARPIYIRETSQFSRIEPITIEQVSLLGPDGQPVSGKVNFLPVLEIKPGQYGELKYTIDGHFPIGKSTGNFEISAPQLKTPVPLKIEIINKKEGYLLVVTILLGWLFGWLIRIKLQQAIDRNATRLKALELVKQIDIELSKRPDKSYQKILKDLRDKIKTALKDNKSEELGLKITEVEGELKNSIVSFSTRQQEIQKRLDEVKGLLESSWFLPPDFEQIISTAKTELAAAMAENVRGNISGAETALDDLEREAVDSFAAKLLTLKNDCFQDLDNIAGSALKLLDLTLYLDDLKLYLQSIDENPVDRKLPVFLQLVRELNLKLYAFTNALKRIVFAIVQQSARKIDNSGAILVAPDSYQSFADKAIKFNNKLNTGPSAVKGVLKDLSADLDELYVDFKRALLDQIVGVTGSAAAKQATQTRLEVVSEIDKGNFAAAVELTVNFLLQYSGNKHTLALKGESLSKALIFNDSIAPQILRSKYTTVLQQINNDRGPGNETFEVLSRDLKWFRILQNILIGLVMGFIGYILFEDSFDGTLANFASIFFWAFGLDISVATLAGLTGKVAQKT